MGMMTETGLPLRVTISGSDNVAFMAGRLSPFTPSRKPHFVFSANLRAFPYSALPAFDLFDDNPSLINGIEANFKKVTPDLIKKTVKEYLRKGNRTILIIDPKAPRQ